MQIENLTGLVGIVFRLLHNGLQKKHCPSGPVIVTGNSKQPVIIFLAVSLKIGTDVKEQDLKASLFLPRTGESAFDQAVRFHRETGESPQIPREELQVAQVLVLFPMGEKNSRHTMFIYSQKQMPFETLLLQLPLWCRCCLVYEPRKRTWPRTGWARGTRRRLASCGTRR